MFTSGMIPGQAFMRIQCIQFALVLVITHLLFLFIAYEQRLPLAVYVANHPP